MLEIKLLWLGLTIIVAVSPLVKLKYADAGNVVTIVGAVIMSLGCLLFMMQTGIR
jgi:hypothetical protein